MLLHDASKRLALSALARLIGLGSLVGVGSLLGSQLLGCAPMRRPAIVPMAQIAYPKPGLAAGKRAGNLVVLLPGAYEVPADFEKEGFVGALHARNLDVDCLAVDSHLGYAENGSIPERILEDVVKPARAQGYKNIWLMGISLGGMSSLLFNQRYPGLVEGIIAIAPYIGTRDTIGRVRDAGGFDAWQATPPSSSKDWETPLMISLQSIARNARRNVHQPYLWLGYGDTDRFADSLSVLRQALPAAQSRVAPGGHDWPPWKALWAMALDDLGDKIQSQ